MSTYSSWCYKFMNVDVIKLFLKGGRRVRGDHGLPSRRKSASPFEIFHTLLEWRFSFDSYPFRKEWQLQFIKVILYSQTRDKKTNGNFIS